MDDTAAHEIPASLPQLQQLKLHGCMVSGDFLSAWPDPSKDADIEVCFDLTLISAASASAGMTFCIPKRHEDMV